MAAILVMCYNRRQTQLSRFNRQVTITVTADTLNVSILQQLIDRLRQVNM